MREGKTSYEREMARFTRWIWTCRVLALAVGLGIVVVAALVMYGF